MMPKEAFRSRMRSFKLAATSLLVLAAVPTIAAAQSVSARCVIEQSIARESYSGPCRLWHGTGGSFSIGAVASRTEILSTLSISLDIERRGVAEVRGLTLDGINSRWGEARRSTKDKACWLGDDFSICVYRRQRR